MVNVTYSVNDENVLVITVDLNQRHGLSASKKSTLVASTEGNRKVGGAKDDVRFGLTVYVPVEGRSNV